MARVCEICGKGPKSGQRVSHAHNITKRTFAANLARVRVLRNGRVIRMKVCTSCLRSGKVKKPSGRSTAAAKTSAA